MRTHVIGVSLALFLLVPAHAASQQEPVLNNILDLDILTEFDPTHLRGVTYEGEETRHMHVIVEGPRWEFGDYTAHVFDVAFATRQVEFQVHTDVGDRAAARAEVDTWAPMFGQFPAALMEHLREVEIIVGEGAGPAYARSRDAWGPSSGSVTICTEPVARHNALRRGHMEEYLLHEVVHVSLDDDHKSSPGWLDAQDQDPAFISPYSRDFPDREDLADTAVAWFGVRYRPDRIPAHHYDAIIEGIPNRLAYLDQQGFDMRPYRRVAPVPALPLAGLALLALLLWRAGRSW